MNIYEELGVKQVINANGIVTMLGGSIMPEPAVEAMVEASRSFVRLVELHEAAGRRIAQLLGVPAAYVCSGCAGGMVLAAAACMTGTDQQKIWQLPDTEGMKNEIVCRVSGPGNYVYQGMRYTGARLVQVGTLGSWTVDDIRAGLSEKTAAIQYYWGTRYDHYLLSHLPSEGMMPPLAEVAEVAREAGVPVIVDTAAAAVPRRNLWEIHQQGGDLVVFSGGKQLFGPQPTGLIVGREDLVEACALNSNPHSAIGRPMKVGKEEIVGLLRTIELYMERDEEEWLAKCQRQAEYMAEQLQDIPHLKAECLSDPSADTQAIIPRTYLTFEEGSALTAVEVAQRLQAGDPPIEVRHGSYLGGDMIRLDPTCLREGEERIIAQMVREAIGGGV